MYAKYIKRFLDFTLSACGLIVLSPVLLVLTVLGAYKMKGNPFFTQLRPGKDEKIFKLIKFRSMTCEVDEQGNPLPDEIRLTKYGKFLRASSLDELPELLNILKGDMSIVGPRPLLVRYLPLYNAEQKHRHDVRPGLTGWAQINGRDELEIKETGVCDAFTRIGHIENINLKPIIPADSSLRYRNKAQYPVKNENGRILISNVQNNSPAQKGGILPGDILVKVNYRDIY